MTEPINKTAVARRRAAGKATTVTALAIIQHRTPQQAADYIRESYQQSVQAIIETGRRLNEIKAELQHGEWMDAVLLMPFSDRTARMYMRIAKHPELANRQHVSDLPASWGTLYVLSQLPAQEVAQRIKAGEITSELQRSQAEDWARVHQQAKQELRHAYDDAVAGIRAGLSYLKAGYELPEDLPQSQVEPAELLRWLRESAELLERKMHDAGA